VRGPGTLAPVETRWIPAVTVGRIDVDIFPPAYFRVSTRFQSRLYFKLTCNGQGHDLDIRISRSPRFLLERVQSVFILATQP
jgi:hypothetical protein